MKRSTSLLRPFPLSVLRGAALQNPIVSELSLLRPMFLLAFCTTVPRQLEAAARVQINGAIISSAKGARRQIRSDQIRRMERSFLHGRLAARPVLSQLSIQVGNGFCGNVAGGLSKSCMSLSEAPSMVQLLSSPASCLSTQASCSSAAGGLDIMLASSVGTVGATVSRR
jgi:hypothetical protein